jgi:hypothetical protein
MDYEDLVDDLLSRHGDAERGQMMGMPVVRRNGTIALGLAGGDAVVFKLPDPIAHGEALKLAGAHLFDPGGKGRAFKEWVVIPPEHDAEWPRFAELAFTRAG